MATSRTLPTSEWSAFLDELSAAAAGRRVEIETAALDLGDQIVAEWVPLVGLTYEGRTDVLDVALEGLTHLIRQPRELRVQEGQSGIESLAVRTASEALEVIRLRDPLVLAAGSGR